MAYNVYLVTKGFPFGNTERSFVTSEYNCIKEQFDVTVFATEASDQEQITYSQTINAVRIDNNCNVVEKFGSLVRFLTKKECYIEFASIIKARKTILRRIFRALMFGTAAETFYSHFKKAAKLTSDTEAIVYFYWFDYKCFGLTLYKNKYKKIKIIARTHGCDLFDARELYGRQFFKEVMDQKLDRLVFASAYAKKYYLSRYHLKDSEKYPTYRLGVSNKEMTLDMRKTRFCPYPFLLLSCSNIIPIKRVNQIIVALSKIENRDIHWIHIGSGEDSEKMLQDAEIHLSKKTNIHYDFLGEIPNEDVIQFYRDNYVGAFITTTSTEGGSPVSVQEALSFGVPVISTAVAELPVMVDGNGILLSENPGEEEVSSAIEQMYDIYGSQTYFSMCSRSLEIFKQMFCEKENYSKLVRELRKLVE